LRSRFELGPNLTIVGVKYLQPAPDTGAMEHAGISNQHKLYVVEFCLLLDLGTAAENFIEVFVRGWLAIATEGYVVESPKISGDVLKPG
jgi:hypothetical protein